ncbi:MAG: hexitol phosphatase HxpB [Bacteroidetes bacterium]|nr:MAG: hexitol phosphatase HxpB [Bacteroidota bacterium]
MIKAVIFDMDGVIIDSEPFWENAEIEIFNKYGIPMTQEMCQDMKGRKIDEVVQHWHEIYPLKNVTTQYIVDEIIAKMHELIQKNGEHMTGLIEVLGFLMQNGYLIALASSSKMELIDTVVDKLKIRDYFKVIHSAEYEPAGKPEPYVYQTTAKKLNIHPEKCMAIEDSYLGLQSAIKAGMQTVAIPEPALFDDPKFNIADYKIMHLSEIIIGEIL